MPGFLHTGSKPPGIFLVLEENERAVEELTLNQSGCSLPEYIPTLLFSGVSCDTWSVEKGNDWCSRKGAPHPTFMGWSQVRQVFTFVLDI